MIKMLSEISRRFFFKKEVITYRMKKVKDMSDIEVIKYCHWYCEENGLISEFKIFRDQIESQYIYCPYLQKYVDQGLCYDIQMVGNGYIYPAVIANNNIANIDKSKLSQKCSECKHQL